MENRLLRSGFLLIFYKWCKEKYENIIYYLQTGILPRSYWVGSLEERWPPLYFISSYLDYITGVQNAVDQRQLSWSGIKSIALSTYFVLMEQRKWHRWCLYFGESRSGTGSINLLLYFRESQFSMRHISRLPIPQASKRAKDNYIQKEGIKLINILKIL